MITLSDKQEKELKLELNTMNEEAKQTLEDIRPQINLAIRVQYRLKRIKEILDK